MTMNPNYVRVVMEELQKDLRINDRFLLRMYTLLVFTTGVETTLEDAHDAWALWRDETRPDHRFLVPFDQLTKEVQELDRKYADSIRRVAKLLPALLEGGDHV
jgi:hypothetical protein